MTAIIIGIDPGLTGAIAKFSSGVLTDVLDLPTDVQTLHRSGGNIRDLIGGRKQVTRRSINPAALARTLREWTEGHSALIIKEKMGKRPNQDSSALMQADGVLKGVIGALGIEMLEVEPANWKRAMGVPADKEVSRKRAIEFFPACKHLFKRKMDHNRAEAALIGLYGVRISVAL